MRALVVGLFDHGFMLRAVDRKKNVTEQFANIEALIASSLWSRYQDAPRILVVHQEETFSLVDISTLSSLDKAFLFLKGLVPSKQGATLLVSRKQALVVQPNIPDVLSKGAVFQIVFPLFRMLHHMPKKESAVYHQHIPCVGTWQVVLSREQIIFHRLFKPSEALSESDLMKDAESYGEEMGENLPVVDVSLFIKKNDRARDGCAAYISLWKYHAYVFPSLCHAIWGASIFFVGVLIYTTLSVNMWQGELMQAQGQLSTLLLRTNTPAYQELRGRFLNRAEP